LYNKENEYQYKIDRRVQVIRMSLQPGLPLWGMMSNESDVDDLLPNDLATG
jgi:hypothetical protein